MGVLYDFRILISLPAFLVQDNSHTTGAYTSRPAGCTLQCIRNVSGQGHDHLYHLQIIIGNPAAVSLVSKSEESSSSNHPRE